MADEPTAGLSRKAEAELVEKIRRGDEAALEHFYGLYFPKLYRYVFYRMGRDHHHAEEVVNDTFIEALDKIERYDPARGSVESWLIMLSRNRIRSANAAMTKPLEYEKSWSVMDGDLENLFADTDRGNLPQTALEDAEVRAMVEAVMGGLSPEYRQLLEYKYVQDQSVREIARRIGRSEKAVESQLTRARAAFREAFREVAAGVLQDVGLA